MRWRRNEGRAIAVEYDVRTDREKETMEATVFLPPFEKRRASAMKVRLTASL